MKNKTLERITPDFENVQPGDEGNMALCPHDKDDIDTEVSDKRQVLALLADCPEDSDFLDDACDLLAEPDSPQTEPQDDSTADNDEGSNKKNSTHSKAHQPEATELINLAREVDLWHTPGGRAYASILIGGHTENWALSQNQFKLWLRQLYYKSMAHAPNSSALQDAIATLEAKALFDGEEHEIHTRLACHDNFFYLDLGEPEWRAVRISPTGWTVVSNPPVRFRRTKGMRDLPLPVEGGNVEKLRPFLNYAKEEDWQLAVAWLLAAFNPQGPYPVLALHGEQGSAKSTFAKVLRELLDPNVAPLRSEPGCERDLMIAANNGWVLAYDNLSHLPVWLSDAICRLATGGGFATRQLYSDDEETLFDATRPVLFTGIEEIAIRGDLIDRSILLYLPAIPAYCRRPEAEFWHEFELAKPRLLGALLSVVASALKERPGIVLREPPRMADFAVWGTAAEPGLGWARGSLLSAYNNNRARANDLALEASPLASAVRQLAESGWYGTASQLLKALNDLVTDQVARRMDWLNSARALSGALRRLAPNLRRIGVDVQFHQTSGSDSIKTIRISQNTAPIDAIYACDAGFDELGG